MMRSCWSLFVLCIRIYLLFLLMMQLLLAVAHADKLKADYTSYLQTAVATRQQIEAAEREMEESLELLFSQLDSAIQAIQPDDLVGERLAIAELRKIIPLLRQEASAIIEAHEAFRKAAMRYGEELELARPIIYQAVEAFQNYAASEPYEDLQEQYRLVAESFVAINSKYQQLKEQVAPSITAVTANLDYTVRTALFLERLEQFLVVMPSDSPNLERFLKSLARYVKSFETLRIQLKKFHKATAGGLAPSENPKEKAPERRQNSTLTRSQSVPRKPVQRTRNQAIRNNRRTSATEIAQSNDSLDDDPFGGDDVDPSYTDEKNAARWDLSGRWTASNGTVSLQLQQQGDRVTVSLWRSNKIRKVEGQLLLNKQTLRAQRLVYHMNSSDVLDLGKSVWQVLGPSRIRCTGPSFARNSAGRYVATGLLQSYTLRKTY